MMNSSSMDNAALCMRLMRADSESEVTAILREAGYWDNDEAWRLFSDSDNSFSVIGNQQAEAVAAFVEKIVNSVDARLVNACRQAGVDPEGPDAPQSMREAVARFFEGKADPRESDGYIAEWPTKTLATPQGLLLTVAATGFMPQKGQPSLTVADQGEGQTPDDFPTTFMSTQRNNKLRIPFVQGKFNMGGTGAFQFSSLQLIVSRRNPAFLPPDSPPRDHEWGFSIVRREWPGGGAKSSVYRYLAPVPLSGSDRRGVLAFDANEWAIFPEADAEVRDAYHRKSPYGSLVKLYEYRWEGVKSNIVQAGEGLLRRIDVGLPELGLPVRVFECRPDYRGGPASFATNALGLIARLDNDGGKNLDTGEPIGGVIALDDGKQIRLRVYVFKDKDKAKNYRNARQGVVFSVNGQMHAAYTTEFFSRRRVNLSYLKDSLLVFADCSAIDGQTREDLFMNSRDRLRVNAVARQLEEKLEIFLHEEPTLRELQNQRRQQATQEMLGEDKPLSDVLARLMKDNPVLNQLFLKGASISTPFPPTGSRNGTSGEFVGQRFPTFFRFKDHDDEEILTRAAHLGSRVRIAFKTDAEDSYFVREVDRGAWKVQRRVGNDLTSATGWTATGPKSGTAQLWFDTLPEDVKAGSEVEYLIEVTDPSRIEAFKLNLILQVAAERLHQSSSGPSGPRNVNGGKGSRGGSNSTLSLPHITPVRRDDWSKHDFDETSALKVVLADADANESLYDFYVNYDNKYLLHSYKQRGAEPVLLEKQFVYGMVLVGLALLQEHQQRSKGEGSDDDGRDIAKDVFRTTAALSPILLPMLEAIGGLSEEKVPA